jgi:hypothetical protein
MSARTFAEWQAYCSLEPFGPQADFWRAGMIASMIANVNRKKNAQPFKPEDFMPKGLFQEEPAHLSPELTTQILKQNFESYNAAQKVTGQ